MRRTSPISRRRCGRSASEDISSFGNSNGRDLARSYTFARLPTNCYTSGGYVSWTGDTNAKQQRKRFTAVDANVLNFKLV
ncbi:hypothetical protein D918_05128 [Trichuris suis]|nr:hypothetical protein D918_05128 [Trichuris suis]